MDKFNKILKNVLIFLVIFLVLNYLLKGCSNKTEETAKQTEELTFITTDTEYSKKSTVTVKIKNNTDKDIFIKSECPNEPFNVYHYENSEWVQKEVSPKLNCENVKDLTLNPGKETKVPYINWNHALFSEMGRFKIELKTEINGQEKTFETNEFTVVKEGILKQLWTGVFYRPLYNTLIFLASVLPKHDLGLAIIILTIIIRTILLIPSQKAMKSQRKMQGIQPKLEKIKEKYKGDQQKIAKETMALWKEAKVNPFGSCLPLLLQFPFLIAIFYVIRDGLNPDNTYLFYNEYKNFTLTDINTNFLSILELTKVNTYVLPLVIGGLQFIQMKLSFAKKSVKKDEKGKKNEMAIANNTMLYIMPIMIAVFTASLPAGVGLYWGISTVYGIIQQVIVNKDPNDKINDDGVKVKVIESKN